MRIYVTEDDIASGCRFSPELCPVAQALNRAGLYHFGVFGSAFFLQAKDHAATLLRLPKPVCDWIASFDAGRQVTPVKFDIELPQPGPDAQRNEVTTQFCGLRLVPGPIGRVVLSSPSAFVREMNLFGGRSICWRKSTTLDITQHF